MKSPSTYRAGAVAILDALGAAAYGAVEIERFMESRAIVLDLARQKAEAMLDEDRLNLILFRGAVSIGTFYADDQSNTIMGEAVSDAAAWHAEAEWIGIHATPRATLLLNSLLEREKDRKDWTMIDYDVPMKSGGTVPLKA